MPSRAVYHNPRVMEVRLICERAGKAFARKRPNATETTAKAEASEYADNMAFMRGWNEERDQQVNGALP